MTFMIILGAVAGVYLAWLMYRLAALALPVYSGIAVGIYLHGQDHDYAASIVAGLAVGGTIWLAGQTLFALVRWPLLRIGIGATFAVPAGFAGYQLAHGVTELVGADGAVAFAASLAGAALTAAASWRSLAVPIPPTPRQITLAQNRPV